MAVGSWVAALYGGKWVHNALANLKTGLNLNQGYFDSSGQRRRLFENPQAIPFQLIPEERFNWTGDRLGIPYTQQRRRLIEEKIQQTTVQNQTWWLLSAGLGLPVFTMGLRDLLQNAAQGLAGKVISSYHLTRARQFREAPVLAERSLDAYLDQQLGAHKFSWLSRWRKRFEETLVKRLELPRHIGLKNALRLDDKALSQAIRSRLESFLTQPDQRLSLMAMKSFLKEETERLDAMNHNVVNLKALRALPPSCITRQKRACCMNITRRIATSAAMPRCLRNCWKAI